MRLTWEGRTEDRAKVAIEAAEIRHRDAVERCRARAATALRRLRRGSTHRGHVAGILARKRARAGARRPRTATSFRSSAPRSVGGPAPPPVPPVLPDFRRSADPNGARAIGPTLSRAAGRRQATTHRPAPPSLACPGRGPGAIEVRGSSARVRAGARPALGRDGRPSPGGRMRPPLPQWFHK